MIINGGQSVRLQKGTTEFKNYFKQIPVPYKIYNDFECTLDSVKSYDGSCLKNYKDHIPCCFVFKCVCVDDKFSKLIVLYRGENVAYKYIEAIPKEYECCRKSKTF